MNDRTVTVMLTEGEARHLVHALMTTDLPKGVKPLGETYQSVRAALDALQPAMEEPTYLGAVVMTDDGLAVRGRADRDWPWHCSTTWHGWCEFSNPRPLTAAEREEHGIPATLPEGHVAVKRQRDEARAFRNRAEYLRNEGHPIAAELCDAYADALEAAGA